MTEVVPAENPFAVLDALERATNKYMHMVESNCTDPQAWQDMRAVIAEFLNQPDIICDQELRTQLEDVESVCWSKAVWCASRRGKHHN